MTLFLDDGDVQLHHGDSRAVLRTMPAESVHCVVTSPPYWGLRDYNVDGQLGLEESPDAFIVAMVGVFAEVRRVLRKDGTVWLNLGDSYAGSWGNQGRKEERGTQRPINGGILTPVLDGRYPTKGTRSGAIPDGSGLKPKDLVGMPWRVALALQADGWWLRSCVIWSKPNPMPESVTDRPTTAHEYVFLLAKSPRYYYDADAVREIATDTGRINGVDGRDEPEAARPPGSRPRTLARLDYTMRGRNLRSVWTIPTEPTPEAHFATFPQALVEPCVRAGTSEHGCCAECGAPWQRLVERTPMIVSEGPKAADKKAAGLRTQSGGTMTQAPSSTTTGWAASCACNADVVPCTVLDPFVGSGTTCLVARRLGRHVIGIDLSGEYLEIARKRIGQPTLWSSPS